MEEKVKEEVKEQKKIRDLRYYLVQTLILLAVVALGLLVVNQALEYRYKSVFLQQPCTVCRDLNPNQSTCIGNCFKVEKWLYPGIAGDWVDSTGKCFGFDGKEVACKYPTDKLNRTLNATEITPYLIAP